ncbi:MAG: hypothetical protein E5W59_28935, partial [Mesorhizobium sp.]
MTSSTRKLVIITATAAVTALASMAFVHPITKAFSQQMPMMNDSMSGDQQMPSMMHMHGMMQHMMRGQAGMQMHGQGTME